MNKDLKEPSTPEEFRKRTKIKTDSKENSFQRYTPLGTDEEETPVKKSNFKTDGKTEKSNKRVHYEDPDLDHLSEEKFIPEQTKSNRGKFTKFSVHYPDRTEDEEVTEYERQEYTQTEDDYTKSRQYVLDDGTLYFTNGPFYKNEMHSRVDRHHKGSLLYYLSF